MNAPLSRRKFLQGTGYIAMAFTLPVDNAFAQAVAPAAPATPAAPAAPAAPPLPGDLAANPMLSAWIKVNSDKSVTFLVGKVELGQGAVTALTQICADELGVTMEQVKVISGDTFLSANQGTTAGSQSMAIGGPSVHQACADIRELLVGLAAAKLGQPAETMKVANGTITAADGKTITYWDLVTGKELEVKATGKGKLRPATEYRYIGKSVPRLDIPAKMTGGTIFVQDMKPDGVVYGAVARPPTYAATLESIDLGPIEKMPGVIKVVRNGSFLGVVATREEQAFAAADALARAGKWKVDAKLPGTDGIFEWLVKAPINKDIVIKDQARTGGDAPVKTIEAEYQRPYHMHGSIGTSAAIAQLGADGVMTINTHSQSVFETAGAIAMMLGMDKSKVRCIHTQGSGCYGHNMADDAAADAALLAQTVPGKPVKLQYSRAQEHQWEPYGSAMVVRTKAAVDAKGNVLDWDLQVWSTPHGTRPGNDAGNLLSAKYLEKPFPQPLPTNGGAPNYSADRNAIALYEFPGQKVTTHFITEMPLRVSSTRGLGAYGNVFAIESFMDELAFNAKADPVEYRLRHLKVERARAVLQACADKFGWAKYEKKEGRGRGIAFAQYKSTSGAFTAVAFEVEVNKRNGRIRILKAVAANDSGAMVNPDGVANQIEGGVTQSLSWTLKEEVKFDNTSVLSKDWASYPILTFTEIPMVDLVLIDKPGEKYLGTGESAQGPTSAALANAVFDAVGVRLRRIPFTPDRVKAAIDKA